MELKPASGENPCVAFAFLTSLQIAWHHKQVLISLPQSQPGEETLRTHALRALAEDVGEGVGVLYIKTFGALLTCQCIILVN